MFVNQYKSTFYETKQFDKFNEMKYFKKKQKNFQNKYNQSLGKS